LKASAAAPNIKPLLLFWGGGNFKTDMKKEIAGTSETQTEIAPEITDKRGYARRWQGSPRWIDCLIAQGLPHLKIGARRVRIHIPEADEWMRSQFHTQRNGKVGSE